MKYNLRFAESLREPELSVMQAYWELVDGAFVHKATTLADAYQMSVHQLTQLSQTYVECQIAFGNCLGCGDELLMVVNTKTAFEECLVDFSRERCPDCQRAFEKRQRFEQGSATEQPGSVLGYNAVEAHPWQSLPADELEALRCIVQFKTKHLIYQQLFKEGSRFNRENIWAVFNRLEKKRLIVVNRNYARGIEGFSYLPELNSVLLEITEMRVTPPVDFLNIKLTENPAKLAKHHADYAAVFTVESDVQLKAGSRYVYGAWVSTKGHINLQITPLASVLRFTNQALTGEDLLMVKAVFNRMSLLHDTDE